MRPRPKPRPRPKKSCEAEANIYEAEAEAMRPVTTMHLHSTTKNLVYNLLIIIIHQN